MNECTSDPDPLTVVICSDDDLFSTAIVWLTIHQLWRYLVCTYVRRNRIEWQKISMTDLVIANVEISGNGGNWRAGIKENRLKLTNSLAIFLLDFACYLDSVTGRGGRRSI